MKQAKLLFLLIAALAFASCGSDEPRYADLEAHEKGFSAKECKNYQKNAGGGFRILSGAFSWDFL